MPKKEYYNVTPEQREIALWRDAKRRQLRELYLKDSGHPTKSLLFDSGLYRFAASKMSIRQYFVPTALGYLTKVGTVAAAIIFTAVLLKKRRDAREHLYRTGQVSYADRPFKFV
ncbi:NADH dehydrogenase [ubiquinone] 1 beta subcomplex subunit 4 [Camponotus japonicus]